MAHMKGFLLRLDDRIKIRLQAKAREEGRTISDIVREYLARGLRQDAARSDDSAGAAG